MGSFGRQFWSSSPSGWTELRLTGLNNHFNWLMPLFDATWSSAHCRMKLQAPNQTWAEGTGWSWIRQDLIQQVASRALDLDVAKCDMRTRIEIRWLWIDCTWEILGLILAVTSSRIYLCLCFGHLAFSSRLACGKGSRDRGMGLINVDI